MASRRNQIKKNLKRSSPFTQGPRYGGPESGRPGKVPEIAILGIQPTPKKGKRRRYL